MSDCFETRAALWPPERPRLADSAVAEARRHIEGCAECQEYFAQDRALLECYDRIRATRAPRNVKERVFDTLARERAGGGVAKPHRDVAWKRRWITPSVAAAALIVSVLGGAFVLASPRASTDDDAMFVEDYLRRAVGEDHIETSDPAEVTRFLTRELGQAFAPLRSEDLEIERAEICLLEGRRGAMIVYKRHGEVISHYVVPSNGGVDRPPVRGRDLGTGTGAPSVITWASPDVEQALVGEVSAEALMALARDASSMEE